MSKFLTYIFFSMSADDQVVQVEDGPREEGLSEEENQYPQEQDPAGQQGDGEVQDNLAQGPGAIPVIVPQPRPEPMDTGDFNSFLDQIEQEFLTNTGELDELSAKLDSVEINKGENKRIHPIMH